MNPKDPQIGDLVFYKKGPLTLPAFITGFDMCKDTQVNLVYFHHKVSGYCEGAEGVKQGRNPGEWWHCLNNETGPKRR